MSTYRPPHGRSRTHSVFRISEPEPREPIVAGESARLIVDTIRSFPVSVDYAGEIVVHNTATGDAALAFERAYERTELELIVEAEHCREHDAHRTMHPDEFRNLVIQVLMHDAKSALGQSKRLDALWM
jgi:hypothetical protein